MRRSGNDDLLELLVYIVAFVIACLAGGYLFHTGWQWAA